MKPIIFLSYIITSFTIILLAAFVGVPVWRRVKKYFKRRSSNDN